MHTIDHPHVPFIHPLYEPLHPGSELSFHGKVHTEDGDLAMIPSCLSFDELLTESAMVASVSDDDESSSRFKNTESDNFDSDDQGLFYDIRGYCYYDFPDATFTIDYDDLKSQFVVELLSGPHIVLHVNFRIYQNIFVLNAASFGNWGAEIRHDSHLYDGDHFHLHIHVHQSHYDIELNGHRIGHFDHRFPYESVQAVGVRGGIHLKKVEFRGFPFQSGWNHDHSNHDFGHGGYIGYGTDSYAPPQFHSGHQHGRHWH
uniref:Galectin n=1 Tax=Panagrolaimus sp. JU765 TaxID=591449 RepID=A0AC34QBD4_9BILA